VAGTGPVTARYAGVVVSGTVPGRDRVACRESAGRVGAMMGRQHACCGLLVGVALAGLVPSAPLPVRGLVVAVAGGAALLPDLDHPGATAARSLGLLTRVIAHAVDWVSLTVYHATRAPGDPAERRSGHRTLTHTVPGCLLPGLLLTVAGLLWPVSLAVACSLLTGLLALGLRRAGLLLLVVSSVVSWWTLTTYPGWWWLVSVAVSCGCLVHLAGDWVTEAGVPLLWPLQSEQCRWRLLTAPVTFPAGSPVETQIVAPLLLLGLLVEAFWATGLLGAVVAAVSPEVSG